jgi:OmpA-OmpF porin, OOP family
MLQRSSSRAVLAILCIAAASCGAPQPPPRSQKLAAAPPPADSPEAEPFTPPEPIAPSEPIAPVDSDKDAIPDVDDKCPNEPETYNGSSDEDGCPDKGLVIITSSPPHDVNRIFFARLSSKIRAADVPILDAVHDVLAAHPEFGRVLVIGYASEDEGTAKKKIALSVKRAEAVIAHLVKGGVEASRLVPAGYGDLCGFDGGHDELARSRNRAVEFKILERDGTSAGIELACPAAIDAGLVPEEARNPGMP